MKLESFVPEIVRRHDREKPWAEWISGAVLFADVSGFTPMSEALAALGAEGAEVLTDILNRYFAEMIGILNGHGGQVMKFGGDAILCFLEGDATGDAALHAAIRMQEAMQRFRKVRTPVKSFTLQMKIGVAAGTCLLAGLGDPAVRCEYAFAGEPVDLAAEAEHHAAAGDVILAPEFTRVRDLPPGQTVVGFADEGSQAANTRPYMIPEVHDMVAAGYQRHAGALSGAVSVFLQFAGFRYERSSFDLQRLHAFVTRVLQLTHEYGGRLNRLSMGDKGSTMLVLFGTPAALEKKEQTACQWAIDVRNMARESFPELELRMGMTSGRVFSGIVGGAGRFEYTVMGDCVNMAARLMQAARSGEVCVDGSMQEKAMELFEFEFLGRRKFKGKAEAQEVYALGDRRRGLRSQLSSAVYGRSEEVNTLLQHLQPVRAGNPCMIVVEGDTGVGKSALVAQVLALASSDWKVVSGKGDITRRGFGYNPWRDPYISIVFDGRMPDLETLSALLQSAGFAEYLNWHADFLGLAAPAEISLRYDEESKRNLLHHQISVLILRSIQSPVLLFLDDLHWFKSEQLDLLAAILNHVKDQPLAILAATRPDWPRESFVNRSTCRFLTLQPLQRESIREMAEKLLEAPVRDNIVDYLEKQARGNPFFLRQLLDHLMRNQLVTRRLGEWTLSREGALDRSLSGEEIVVTQVEQLSLLQKMHLRAASCIGPTFSQPVLQKTLGSSFRVRAMQSLRAGGFVQEALEGRLAFPHALFQEALYHSLPKRLRRQYHRRIGRALEECHAAEIEKYHPTLAHHFYEGGVRKKAVEYCIAAGNDYHTRRSFPEALQYLSQAASLLHSGDSRIWDVELKCADNLLRLGRVPESLQCSRKTRTRARRLNHPAYYAARAVEFDARYQSGDYSYIPVAHRMLQDPDLAKSMAPHRILYYIAVAEYREGKYDAASSKFAEIIAREIASPTVLASYMYYASIAKLKRNFDDAIGLLNRALDLALQSKSYYRALSIRSEQANVMVESGSLEQATVHFRELLPEIEALGDFNLLGFTLLNLGTAEALQKHLDLAGDCLKEARDIFSRNGFMIGYGKSLLETGALFFDDEKYDEAYNYYLHAVQVFEKAKQMSQGCAAYYNVAEVLTKLGRNEEALQWLSKGKNAFNSKDIPYLAELYASLEKRLLANTQ